MQIAAIVAQDGPFSGNFEQIEEASQLGVGAGHSGIIFALAMVIRA
jgi:hypothetical protein